MEARAAGLAAELSKAIEGATVTIATTHTKSEFQVQVNGVECFSRLKERRFPELEELVGICKKQGGKE